jgi:hypothetical protein
MDLRQITVTLPMSAYADVIGNLRIMSAESADVALQHSDDPVVNRAISIRSQQLKRLADILVAAGARPVLPAVSGFGHMGFMGAAA